MRQDAFIQSTHYTAVGETNALFVQKVLQALCQLFYRWLKLSKFAI